MNSDKLISIVMRMKRFHRFMSPEAPEQFLAELDDVCDGIRKTVSDDRADEIDRAVFAMLPKSLDSLPAEPKPEDCTAAIGVLKMLAEAYVQDRENGSDRKTTVAAITAERDALAALASSRGTEVMTLTVELETANERLRLSELALGAAIQRLDAAKEKAREYIREIGDKTKFKEVDAL